MFKIRHKTAQLQLSNTEAMLVNKVFLKNDIVLISSHAKQRRFHISLSSSSLSETNAVSEKDRFRAYYTFHMFTNALKSAFRFPLKSVKQTFFHINW